MSKRVPHAIHATNNIEQITREGFKADTWFTTAFTETPDRQYIIVVRLEPKTREYGQSWIEREALPPSIIKSIYRVTKVQGGER